MTKPILITGASGSIGSELTRNLIAREVPVRLALRDPNRSPHQNNPLVETVYFDYRDKTSLQKAVEGVAQVFFLTPATMQAKQESFDELEAGLSFIEIMKTSDVQHIVRGSGMGADRFKESAHYLIEQAIQKSGMNYTILRPTFFMQIFDVYYRNSIQKKNVIDFYDAGVAESFIDIRDIAAVAAEALLNPIHHNQIYTLTSEELLTYEMVAEILTHTLARKITYVAKSDEDSYKALVAEGWSSDAVNSYVGYLQAAQQGLFSAIHPDVEKILGRKPISFKQYAKDYATAWSSLRGE